MTREQKIDKIYEVMAGNVNDTVVIGNILRYIDINCFYIDTGESLERDIPELNRSLHTLFYLFISKQDKPIEEQNDDAIDYVYNLIQQWNTD